MAGENFSIGAFYNITKNQENPMKTVGRDNFLSPNSPLKYKFFRGHPAPRGRTPLYSRGHNETETYNIMSKFDRNRVKDGWEKLHRQTNRQTNRHYENNGHLAVNQYFVTVAFKVTYVKFTSDSKWFWTLPCSTCKMSLCNLTASMKSGRAAAPKFSYPSIAEAHSIKSTIIPANSKAVKRITVQLS